jgi:hypothetical protein
MERAGFHAAAPNPTMNGRNWLIAALACAGLLVAAGSASADKIKHPTAVFAGLDKITGRIIAFEAAIDETVQFGSLQITPRVCYSRPPTEAPQTDVFAEVDEVAENKTLRRIFTGWMFADSPGMHGVEHAVYDIWLTDCKGGTQIIHETPEVVDAPSPEPPDADLAAAPPDAKAAAAAAAKKRKPKPGPAVIEASPLGIGGAASPAPAPAPSPTPSAAPAPRNPPARRYFPTDAPPIPPANIPP